uniref:Putative endonuclease/reverse transcript n=1 Tax=Ixodes ricinus TaxID=34613 RepID=A0A0K8RDJ3_IXORI
MSLTRNKKNVSQFQYSLKDEPLHRVTDYKYLGVLITSDLNWNAHVKYVFNKTPTKLFFLKRTLKSSSCETKLLHIKPLYVQCSNTQILPGSLTRR